MAEPLAFEAGDTNLYRYVGNSPADRVDPEGLAGRPAVITDLAPDRARDAVIAKHAVEIVEEMKAENWVPSNPENPGEFGNEFERRLNARLAKDGPRGTNKFYSDVCVEGSTGKVLKIGGGPGPKDSVQVDVVYYRGELKPGDKIDKSRVIDVYDAKTGRVHTRQMEKIKDVTGKNVKIIASPEKWTGGGWRAVESVQKKLKFFKALQAGFTVFAIITTRVEAREIDQLICERENAGDDLTKIQVWAHADLRRFVDSFIQESAATRLVVQFYIAQEKARLER